MPIYEYRCANCAHELETLQKISEPALSTCPACNHESLVKQVSAAGFQLKGSGWYATDFRNGSGKKPANGDAKTDAAKTDTAKPDAAKSDAPATTSPASEAKSAAAGGCGTSCACH